MGRVIDGADRAQRRWTVLGYPIAVIYKYYDDQGPYLASIITYYAFIAIFPIMLLASSILGFVLQGNSQLQEDLIDSALAQFPIIGTQLNLPDGLKGSTGAIIIGAVVAIYGALGLGQSVQNALNIAWSVPRNSRPNPFLLRLKSLILLMTAGVAVLVVSALSILGSSTEVFSDNVDSTIRWAIQVATVLLNGTVLTILFRLGSAREHRIRYAAPGGFATALMWLVLQYFGTLYVTQVLAKAGPVNQTFGLVLGLMGLIYFASVMGVLGMEINVVLARRLWPRALLTPFTDNVELTEADRRAYVGYARAQRHKGFETVEVTFTDTQKLRMLEAAAEDDGADHAS
ncbi:MAG: YihY/virulence factor BrkB family protein [Nocardioides sp.]|nr:YihY/virulence factor BrkB family protein [Nocardioidaceae bacterium]MCB8958601.1 YihY/virulence factor BrkB family protein [Nocardioides sp.]